MPLSPQLVPPQRRLGAGLAILAVSLTLAAPALAQVPPANYDEAKVGQYTLPDPLKLANGQPVPDAATWRTQRRPEIVRLLETSMFGLAPGRPEGMTFQVTNTIPDAVGGRATRKEVVVLFNGKPDGPRMDLAVYIPNGRPGPFPAFVGLNFDGNHGVDPDPRVPLSRSWMRNDEKRGISDNKATDKSRGSEASRWPLATILDRGYAVATAYYGDIDPDYDDGFQNGVHPMYYAPGQTRPQSDEWGSIAAWGWGLSRALDYLETDSAIDAKHVAVLGHSRLGKAALWAGAKDERFAAVISNDSGEGGAALSHRDFGETVKRINTVFPHWFATNYKRYNDRPAEMPFDAHMILSLVAPRPLLVCSAVEDQWADPRGEFLSALHADPVYRLLGTDGLAVRDMPGPNVLVWSRIGYHIRPGKHDVTDVDWAAYLDFVDRQVLGRSTRPEGAKELSR